MKCSPARLAANRRNALLSTGPKTEEGKARSRANALTHGLCASTLEPESFEVVQSRTLEWYWSLKPQTRVQGWITDKVALLSLRIDRCERIERRLRDRKSLHAEVNWDEDRRMETEVLASDLAVRPIEVVEELRKTSHGCDWLISRWSMLAHVADSTGTWTSEQTELAYQLMGTPRLFRTLGRPGDLLDDDGCVFDPLQDRSAVARRELLELRNRRLEVSDLDEVDRTLATVDLSDENHPALRRLRRYESTLHRRLRWFLDQFSYESPHRHPHPDLESEWKTAVPEVIAPHPQPALQAQPQPEVPVVATVEKTGKAKSKAKKSLELWQMMPPPHPPFDLELDELPADPNAPIDFDAILHRRKEKKAERSQANREKKRKRLERLRAS